METNRICLAFSIMVACGGVLAVAAQPAAVIGVGFTNPTAPAVALGSLTTFFVHGIGSSLKETRIANTIPLPSSMAGISATYDYGATSGPIPLPVYAVRPFQPCSAYPQRSGCESQFVAITVQVPFWIPVNFAPIAVSLNSQTAPGHIAFSENGVVVAGVDVSPQLNQVHVLRNCDVFWNQPLYPGECLFVFLRRPR